MKSSIIIIDDCELIRFSLLKRLPDYLSSIQFYNNLSDALKALRKVREREKYILFIIDLEVVTYNGVKELIRTMLPEPFDIILLTSMPLVHIEKEMEDKRIAKIITKPFNVKELTETIIRLSSNG